MKKSDGLTSTLDGGESQIPPAFALIHSDVFPVVLSQSNRNGIVNTNVLMVYAMVNEQGQWNLFKNG